MEKQFGNILLRTLPTEQDVYVDMALAMLETIQRNNAINKPTAMIVPVGPTGQYPIFAELVNRLGVSLKNVHLFNMDEYLITPTQAIDPKHPMSFHARMESELYSRLDPALTIPELHRHFPEPGNEKLFDDMIDAFNGVDLCLGGIGINGHIAFNEPPEPGEIVSVEEFAALNTRVLPISRETRTVNAIGYQRGDLRGMPEWCITVGMRQILAAKKIYLALSRDWQHGIVKHILNDEPTAAIPCSLLQNHPSVQFVSPEAIARGL